MYQVLGSIYKGRGAEGKEGKGKGREGIGRVHESAVFNLTEKI
jgi:hypothetical protein